MDIRTGKFQAVGLLIILTICCIAVSSQTVAVTNSPSNTVKGHVSLKGQPIADVSIRVRLTNSNSARPPTYRGRSDQEGNYVIANVPNGTYQVSPEAPEFWTDTSRPRVLILADGESIENVDFALARGGVITGKVMTLSGNRPLIAQQVVLRTNLPDSQPPRSETDDRGIYRIFGLPPGKYKVVVTPPRSSTRRLPPFDETFFPATTDAAKAELVEVGEGSEVKGVDITVEMDDTSHERFDVSGRVIETASGQPAPQMLLRLQILQESGVQYSPETATSDKNGQFKFEELIPGKYRIVSDGPHRSDLLRAEITDFVVNDRQVTDLLIKATRKASVSGIVVVETAQSKASLTQFGPLFLNASVTNEGSSAWAESARVSSDGSFQMFGLQRGLAEFSVGSIYSGGLHSGLSVARVERDGIGQGRSLEIKGEENITGVRVVLKYTTGIIRGLVKLSAGELPTSARFSVQIRSVGRESWVQAVVDARGHFVAEGLPEGTYEVQGILFIPGRRPRQADTKQQVSVSEGNVSEVLLTLELPANP